MSIKIRVRTNVSRDSEGWASVLSFKSDGGARNLKQIGDRIPAIFLNNQRFIHFTSAVNGKRNYNFNFHSVKLHKWYSIAIEQKRENDKVSQTEKLHKNEINL